MSSLLPENEPTTTTTTTTSMEQQPPLPPIIQQTQQERLALRQSLAQQLAQAVQDTAGVVHQLQHLRMNINVGFAQLLEQGNQLHQQLTFQEISDDEIDEDDEGWVWVRVDDVEDDEVEAPAP
jgi:hypothetical protein